MVVAAAMAVRIQRLCCVGARAKMRTRSVLSLLVWAYPEVVTWYESWY